MPSCSLDIIALMHLAVAINGQIYDAEIDSDEIGRSYRRDIRRLNAHKQKPPAVLAPEEIALAVFSLESLGLVFAHDDRNDGPTFESQQGNTINSLESHQALVIRNAGVFFESGAFGFVSAVSFADLGNASDGHLSRESEVIAQLAVVELLKFDLVVRPEAESFPREPIGGGVESPHRGGKLSDLIPIGQKLCLQGQFHNGRLYRKYQLQRLDFLPKDDQPYVRRRDKPFNSHPVSISSPSKPTAVDGASIEGKGEFACF